MKAIIIEDEQSAATNLAFLLNSIEAGIQIIESIETVSDAITFFRANVEYDLVFMDIHLADGNSFEIVKKVDLNAPIIFTTAFDQYAIQAFKLNSIDYLLKPIREEELKDAIGKFKKKRAHTLIPPRQIAALVDLMKAPKKEFRSSFLVQKKDIFIPIPSNNFAFFFIQDGVVRGTTKENATFSFNEKLEKIENDLDPGLFFRANRQYLVQRSAIESLQTYFKGKLIVNISPKAKDQIVVSKANAPRFKMWLNDAKF